MEFKVKSNVINITPFDTENTITDLIAFNQDTLPEYVKLLNFDIKKPKAIFLDDELKSVKKEELVEKVNEKAKEWSLAPRVVALHYLKLKNIKPDEELVKIFSAINKTDFYNLYSIKTAYDIYNALFIEKSNKLVDQVKKEQEIKKKLLKYKGVDTTSFIQDSIVIDYELTTDVSLDQLDLFNSFKTSKNIPFVYLITGEGQQYYKIYENFIPLDEWFDVGEELGSGTMNIFIKKKDGYSYCSLTRGAEEKILLTIEASIEKNESKSQDEIRQVILDSFTDITFKVVNKKEKGIKGVFAVPEININREVFLELLTNDPLVSYYMYVDEVRFLSSKKTILYLYYEPLLLESSEAPLTCFISQKIVSRGDIFFINKSLPLFTPYLNIRVSRALTISQIERFKEAFGIILGVYKDNFDNIVADYSNYVPNFAPSSTYENKIEEEGEESRLKKLQIKNPDLFIYGYPTKCEKTHQPIPIEKNEIKKWKDKREIIEFPSTSKDYYVCPDETYKHPGLKNNKLQNSEEYKYLLCCYINNTGKPHKLWKQYNENLDVNVEVSKATNIVHLKMVTDGKLGYLPRNVYYIMKNFENPDYLFYRKGVVHDNNSFLHAVLLALDPDYENVDNKGDYVSDVRRNLLAGNNDPSETSIALANVIQQLYYLRGQDDVLASDIFNDDIVFDSKKFIGLVEAYYGCKIVIFERNDDAPNGDFELPLYTQGYLYKKFDENKKTVIIYKHKGIRADHLTDYHYELIVGVGGEKEIRYLENDKLIDTIGDFFNKKYKLYLLGLGLGSPENIVKTLKSFGPLAKGQVIDIYGKCRGLLLTHNIFISTSPIEPVPNLEIIKEAPDDKPTLKTVQTFLSNLSIKILQQDMMQDNKIKGVLIKIPGITFSYIAIKPTGSLSGIPKSTNLGELIGVKSVKVEKDVLLESVKNRKIADFMIQLMLYSFSNYHNDKIATTKYKTEEKKWDELSTPEKVLNKRNKMFEIADEFLENKLVIKKDYFDADIFIPRKITFNNNFFDGDKLIVDSEESLNRIKYYLKYILTSNLSLALNYKNKLYLDHYYTFSTDFKSFPGEMIFIGTLSIMNWIKSKNKDLVYTVNYELLLPKQEDPYFFSNWKLKNGDPVIIQNVQGGLLTSAIGVSINYIKKGINTGFNTLLGAAKETAFNEYYFNNGILYVKTIGKSSTPTNQLPNVIKLSPAGWAAILYPF